MTARTAEADPTPRRGVPVWVVAVVAAVVLVVGVVVTYAVTRPTSQPPGPAPTTTSPEPQETPPAPDAPVGGYEVVAGAGGTDVAVDGLTPIGYDQDCSGAVSAATNYYVAVTEGLYQDRHTVQSFSELLKEINGGLDGWDTARTGPMDALVTEFETIRAEAEQLGQEFPGLEEHPEWGAFRVEGCAEGASATVVLGSFVEATFLAPGYSSSTGARVRVSWFEGDWRLISVEDLGAGEHPAAGIVPVDAAAPLPASLRRAMITAGGPQWMEYANAPED
jgi:hypothetical protein